MSQPERYQSDRPIKEQIDGLRNNISRIKLGKGSIYSEADYKIDMYLIKISLFQIAQLLLDVFLVEHHNGQDNPQKVHTGVTFR